MADSQLPRLHHAIPSARDDTPPGTEGHGQHEGGMAAENGLWAASLVSKRRTLLSSLAETNQRPSGQ